MGGMNKDLSTSSFKEDVYIDGNNIRLVSGGIVDYDTGSSAGVNDAGVVTNVKGNKSLCTFTGEYVGHTFLRDNLILLTSNKGVVTDIEVDTPFVDYTVTAPDHGLSVDEVIRFGNTENYCRYFYNVDSVVDTDTIKVSLVAYANEIVQLSNYGETVPGTTKVEVTNPHYLISGQAITIATGSDDYDGAYIALVIDSTSFYIYVTYTEDVPGYVYYGQNAMPQVDETDIENAYWYEPRDINAVDVTNIGIVEGSYYGYRVLCPQHRLTEGKVVFLDGVEPLYSSYYIVRTDSIDPDNAFQVRSLANVTPGTTPTIYTSEPESDKIYRVPLSLLDTEESRSISITDYSGTVAGTIKATCGSDHGLATGDIVRFVGTTDYDGEYSITKIDSDEFYATATYTQNRTGTCYYFVEFLLQDGYYFYISDNNSLTFDSNNQSYYYNGLVYKGDLKLNPSISIRMYANYETENIQKVYWLQNDLPLHHINTVYNADTNNLITLPVELLEMVPTFDHNTIDITLQSGGSLPCGKLQYAYQLYKINGSQTTFSPASYAVNVGPISDDIASLELFRGGDLEETASKSAVVEIDMGESGELFDRIRVVALEYSLLNTPPTIRIVAEEPIYDDTITIYDYGVSLGEMDLEEFQFIQNDVTGNTFLSKNNYLIVGNTTDKFFDVDQLYLDEVNNETSGRYFPPFLDTRAYRWRAYSDSGSETIYASEDNTNSSVNVANNYSFLRYKPDVELYEQGKPFLIPGSAEWKIVIPITITPPSGPPSGYVFRTIDYASITKYQDFLKITVGGSDIRLDLSSITYIEYQADIANALTIKGDEYYQDYYPDVTYSGLSGTGATLDEIQFDFNYTMDSSVGIDGVECIVNKDMEGEKIVTTTAFDSIPETHDCINTMNNVSNDDSDEDQFQYQSDGTTRGGEGPIISYQVAQGGESDTYTTAYTGNFGTRSPGNHNIFTSINPWTYNIYMNYNVSSKDAVYMPDEVYRFGIVFYDLKMRLSFVKWITDIRMPTLRKFNVFSNSDNFSVPWLKFQIDSSKLPSGFMNNIKGWQYVRVPRRTADKSVVANGIMSMTIKDGSSNYYSPVYLTSASDYGSSSPGAVRTIWDTPSGQTHDRTLIEFICADAAFNKEFNIQSGDYIEAIGQLEVTSEATSFYTAATPKSAYYSIASSWVSTSAFDELEDPSTRANCQADINDGFFSSPEKLDPVSHSVNSKTYFARATDGSNQATTRKECYRGSCVILDVDEFPSTSLNSGSPSEAIVINYKRNLGLGMYGGCTYSQRSLNTYIPCSRFISKDEESTTTRTTYFRGGDVFLSHFVYLKCLFDPNYENDTEASSGQSLVTFPTISVVNVDWRNDQLLHNVSFGDSNEQPVYHLNEVVSWGISDFPITYPIETDLYIYNSVYSSMDMSRGFIPEPFDFNAAVHYDTRLKYSNLKIAGEYSDSWLKFKDGNVLDLDGNYGELTRIISLNNDVLFFQPFAVGRLGVLDREVLPSNASQSLFIGSGTVLERYDYITNESGTSFYDSIVSAEGGIYYYDNYCNMVQGVTTKDGKIALSEVKGLKSFFDYRTFSNVVGGYDKENREVLFSLFHDDNTIYTDKTLVYSLFNSSFIGFQNFTTEQFITRGRIFLSTYGSTSLYRHNIGNYGEFYGSTGDSTISLIVNPYKMRTSTFHTVEFLTNVYNGATHLPNTTLDSIGISNSYQTGTSLTTFTQRIRSWRNNLLREESTDKRMRDNFLRLDITLTDNSNNYKYVLHPFITNYLPTKIK